jgi:hypothetical protein
MTNLGEALSTICRQINQKLRADMPGLLLARALYSAVSREAVIQFYPLGTHALTEFTIRMVNTGNTDDFFDMMNVPTSQRADYFVAPVPTTGLFTFPNVWDRYPEHLYFHASFVNHTQFNYLGQHGDFYSKPSKIYTADNLPSECYFWISIDGMTPIVLPFEEFLIELAFIIDSTDYQSP